MDGNMAGDMNFVYPSLSLGSLSYRPMWSMGTAWSDQVQGLSTTVFPGDIIVEVLAKLPIESLVRFLCVCKVWYSVVKDKRFHDKYTNNNKKKSLLFEGLAEDMSASVSTANMPPSRKHIVPPFPLKSCYTLFQGGNFLDQYVIKPPLDSLAPVIIGIINGIVCLVAYNSFVLWNPATREAFRVPAPSNFPQNEVCPTFGFSLDMETKNDYRIVRVTYGKKIYKTPHVEIYSTMKNSWTVYSQSIPFNWFLYGNKCSAILEGIPYWKADETVGHLEGMPLYRDFITGFSPCSNTFIEVKLPKLRPYMADKFIVGTVGHSLAIGLNRTKVFEVMSLDDNGWKTVLCFPTFNTKIMNVKNWIAHYSNSVIIAKTSEKFFIINTCSAEIAFPPGPQHVVHITDDVFAYSESLVPPNAHSRCQPSNLNQRCF